MALSGEIVEAVVVRAAQCGVKAAALLAVVEVESEGAPLEIDGKTPCLLFERHVFHRELKARAPGKLAAAVAAGLAIPKWSKATQYKDQGSSARRLALLDAARAMDVECANRACSWGLGQTMGFLAEELGYRSATAMVAEMVAGGVPKQIDMMVAEIRSKGLFDALEGEDWDAFARSYNGSGYKENRYDTKLAGAFRRWERHLAAAAAGTAPPALRSSSLSRDEVMAVQQRLADLGYPQVGVVDGRWGEATTGAVAAFQRYEGLAVSGDYDDATRQALAEATPRAVSDARAATTVDDLRAAGSQTVAAADTGRGLAKLLALIGIGGGAGQVGDKAGLLDQARGALDQAQALRPVVEGTRELLGWITSCWWIAALVVAVLVWRTFGAVIARRIADQVSGRHA